MATYNGAAFLSAQLQSLASQTVMPAELVISDDGSSDTTVAIIEQFARTAHFPVRLTVNKERLGYKRNFMSATERCEKDIIAFCDQDDIWYSSKILEVSRCMADEAVSLCFHDYDLIGPDDHRLSAHRQSQSSLLRYESISSSLGMAQTFRRSLLRFTPLFDLSRDENRPNEVMAHDQWIHFLARCDGTVRHIPHALLGYRQHDNNVSGQAHRNPEMGGLPSNPAILAARLRGRSQAFEKKRNLLLADLQCQQFSLTHRMALIRHLVPLLSDQGLVEHLESTYSTQLSVVSERRSLYASLSWPSRISTFAHMLLKDAAGGALQARLKLRLLDLAYGPYSTQ